MPKFTPDPTTPAVTGMPGPSASSASSASSAGAVGPHGLSLEELRLLDLIEQDYFLTRYIPTKDTCLEKYGIAKTVYTNAFKKALFRESLEQRGIIIRGIEDVNSSLHGLTPRQLACFNTMLDLTDNRSRKKKLQDLKVSTVEYEGWLRDPAVQHYLRQRTEGALQDNQHEAHLALIDNIRQGDLPSIKYFNEVTGRYNPQQSIDVAVILTKVTEIIMRNVRDAEIQANIAEELLSLAAGAGLSSAMGAVSAASNSSRRVIEASAVAF